MQTSLRTFVVASAVATLTVLGSAGPAGAEQIPNQAAQKASCLGSGSAFYGTFAPRQRAFVAEAVIDQADASGEVAGDIYRLFAAEKEGGSIPAPCGTRLE